MIPLSARVRAAAPYVRPARLARLGSGLPVTRADGLMLIAMLIWGINITSAKIVVRVLPPLGFGLLRYAVAASVLLAILRRHEGSVRVRRSELRWLALSGAVGLGLNQVGFLFGVRLVSATMAAIILATAPLLTAAVAVTFAREPLHRGTVVALLVAFAGVVVVILGGGGGLGVSWGGGLLVLLAALTLGLGAVFARPPLRAYTSLRVTMWLALCGALTLLPVGLPALLTAPWSALTPLTVAAMAFTVFGSTVAGNLAWNYGIKRLGATRTVAYTYLQPVTGIIFAALLLGERLTPLQWLGGGVVLLGEVLYSVLGSTVPAADTPAEPATQSSVPRVPMADSRPSAR